MKETIFEKYLKKSLKAFKSYKGNPPSLEIVRNKFFVPKFAEEIKLYQPIEDSKNALILVGQTCVGKTTFANAFIKKHPDFTLVSMDRCVGTELKSMAQEESDHDTAINVKNVGNHTFGLELEANHQNIIVDGNWLHVNSRVALLKTLYELNYITCIFLILPQTDLQKNNMSFWESNIRHKCMELVAAQACQIPLYEIFIGDVNPIEEYAKETRLPMEILETILQFSPRFDLNLSDKHAEQKQEIIDSNLQLENQMFFFGADMLTTIDPQTNPYI